MSGPLDPETARQMRELDEAATYLANVIPRLARGMFEGFTREGFSEAQATRLTEVWLAWHLRDDPDPPDRIDDIDVPEVGD